MKKRRSVVRMTWDQLGRGGWHVTMIPKPRWRQVVAAIDRLDGRIFTCVQLESPTPGVTMELLRSGDVFLCGHQRRMGEGVVLIEPDVPHSSETLTFRWGDREYVFPRRCGVSKAMALPALRWFFESGDQPPALEWEVVTGEIAWRKKAP